MKIFISGSKIINNQLPNQVLGVIDKKLTERSEIIIGDCFGIDEMVQKYLSSAGFRNVTVYVSGAKQKARHNIGNWEEKNIQIDRKRRTAYSMRLEKDFQMAQDADEGLAIWDGESKGTFINLVNLSVMGKKSRVFLIKENKWINIESIEDIKPYRGKRSEWTKEDINYVLETCGFSDEMIEHLVSLYDYGDYDMSDYVEDRQDVYCYGITDIICQAPIALKEKEVLLHFLMKKRNMKSDIYIHAYRALKREEKWKKIKKDVRDMADWAYDDGWSYMWEACEDINEAIKMLDDYLTEYESDGEFYLFSEWYDTDSFVEKSFGQGLFSSMKEVMDYIDNEIEEDNLNEEYFRVESWKPKDPKHCDYKKTHKYDYYIFDGNVCWFEKMRPEVQDNGNTYYMPASRMYSSGNIDLNRSVPYRTGDIVKIDCRPFGPPFHAMVLESRELYDCCFPTIIFNIPFTDKWRVTSLKHRMFYKHTEVGSYEPMLSPLYRLRSVSSEEIDEDDEPLKYMSGVLGKDENRAEMVWKMWSNYSDSDSDISFEVLKELFECIHK